MVTGVGRGGEFTHNERGKEEEEEEEGHEVALVCPELGKRSGFVEKW